jgi:hypothetical protein
MEIISYTFIKNAGAINDVITLFVVPTNHCYKYLFASCSDLGTYKISEFLDGGFFECVTSNGFVKMKEETMSSCGIVFTDLKSIVQHLYWVSKINDVIMFPSYDEYNHLPYFKIELGRIGYNLACTMRFTYSIKTNVSSRAPIITKANNSVCTKCNGKGILDFGFYKRTCECRLDLES